MRTAAEAMKIIELSIDKIESSTTNHSSLLKTLLVGKTLRKSKFYYYQWIVNRMRLTIIRKINEHTGLYNVNDNDDVVISEERFKNLLNEAIDRIASDKTASDSNAKRRLSSHDDISDTEDPCLFVKRMLLPVDAS
jgi:hypothetical protein